jgi:hypothetical protein
LNNMRELRLIPEAHASFFDRSIWMDDVACPWNNGMYLPAPVVNRSIPTRLALSGSRCCARTEQSIEPILNRMISIELKQPPLYYSVVGQGLLAICGKEQPASSIRQISQVKYSNYF